MEFNLAPYWDDFEATNGALERNYMRILFRPGYAVQARELTQIQSIIQNQIKQFGDHIFKDGSPVIGGHLTLDTGVRYVKLDTQDASGQDIDLENFLGVTVFNTGTPKTRARVLQTFDNSTDRTLMVRYLRGPGFSQGQTLQTAAGFSANVINESTFTGLGSTVSINRGVFYVNGFFVTVLPQTIVLDPYSSTPTYRIGLEIDEEIITDSVDNALLDPAQESFNYQAPGANRYQFSLNLARRTIDSIDDRRFFELLRVENGVITKQVSYPIYSELEKTLARRTYDESGNYAVRPFRINLSANTPVGLAENTSTFIVNIEPGKAYVKGFEFETIGTTKLPSTRARTTNSSKDYDLSVYYGNRIYVDGLEGSAAGLTFSDTALNEVDLHCVSANGVTLDGNSEKYYSTRMGTAKVRNLDRVSGDLFNMYLTDVNFSPIVTTANSTTNVSAITFGSHFSDVQNAYQNCVITILNNFGSNGNVARVTSYDGTTKTAFIDPPIKTTMLRGALFSITIPSGFSRSVMVANESNYTAANLKANIAAVGVGRDTLGNTIYEDANFDSMVYKIPNFYVKYDSDQNVDFYRRVLRTGETFAGGNGSVTIAVTGQTFDFGSDGALVSAADRSENIMVVAKTGANAGKVIDMTLGNRSVFRTDNQTITLYTENGSGASFTGDVYLTTKITNANGAYRRVKTLVQSNAAITTSDTLATATGVTNYGGVYINASNGTVWFTTSNVITKTTGVPQSLFLSDVVKVKKIYDSTSMSFAPNTTNAVDITDRYTFNGGQTDSYYDHASITLKPGVQPPSGQTVVMLDYYTHTGTGYLSQKSYANNIYETEQIPIYKNQAGQLYNLRDCIDMRPLRVSGLVADPFKLTTLGPTVNVDSGGVVITANTSRTQNVLNPPLVTGSVIKLNGEFRTVSLVENPTQIRVSKAFASSCTNGVIQLVGENLQVTGGVVQRPTDALTIDYEYYLPRIDKVVATKDKEFKLISGVPSLAPEEPSEPIDSMAIYTMYLPPYTASLKSVNLKFIENRRYTMKDIGKIDERVAQLEEYVRLKESEKDIISNPPTSPETPLINKPIYGTIVDEFNDLSVVDNSPSSEFAASIERGVLSSAKLVKAYSLEPTAWSTGRSATGSSFSTDKLFMLRYTETPFVSQKLFSNTSAETVQTAVIAKFEGFVNLTPERDYFYSKDLQPSVSDSFGRFTEPVTPPPTPPSIFDPNYTGNIIEKTGGGGYDDRVYAQPVVVEPVTPPSRTRNITVPHWSQPPVLSRVPEYIDFTETFVANTIANTTGNITVNVATAPDTVLTDNVANINLAAIGLAIGGLINLGGLEDRYINYIEPDGSFLQVNTNFTETQTSTNLANVTITETYTPITASAVSNYEPSILRDIPLDFTAIMPKTYLDDVWAPPPAPPIPPVEEPIFAPAWTEETILAPALDIGFDKSFGAFDTSSVGLNVDFDFSSLNLDRFSGLKF